MWINECRRGERREASALLWEEGKKNFFIWKKSNGTLIIRSCRQIGPLFIKIFCSFFVKSESRRQRKN